MDDFSDLKIIGLDKERPPKILGYPCIFLFFELNHEAPKEWCDDFVRLHAKAQFPVKMDPEVGLFIETWVRTPEEIAKALAGLQRTIPICTAALQAKIRAKLGVKEETGAVVTVSPAQKHLNSVVEALNFEL